MRPMPNLDLSNITSNDSKAAMTTAKIMALMHFPNDSEMQGNYAVVSLAKMIFFYEESGHIPHNKLHEVLSRFLHPFDGLKSLFKSPSVKEMFRLTNEAREQAFIAGNILYGIYWFNSMNPNADRNNKMSVNNKKSRLIY